MSAPLNEFSTTDANAQDPGTLRKLLEQKIAELKAVTAENVTLKSKQLEQQLGATWQELQVPDAIRKLYQGDPTADAIKAWWADSKGLFNIEVAAETPVDSPEQVELAQQMQAAQQAATLGGDATSGGYAAFGAKAQEIKGKQGPVLQADLDALFNAAGIPKY